MNAEMIAVEEFLAPEDMADIMMIKATEDLRKVEAKRRYQEKKKEKEEE